MCDTNCLCCPYPVFSGECLSGVCLGHSAHLFGSFLGGGSFSHSTGVNSDCVLALLAANGAAPGELAGAALHHLSSPGSVPWPAADQLTAVWCKPRGSCVWKTAKSFVFIHLVDRLDFLAASWPHWSYHYISYQQSRGYRCQGLDDRSLGMVQGTKDLWQQGVWPGGHGEAGLFWIRYESGEPEKRMMVEKLVRFSKEVVGFWKSICFK